MTISKFFKHPIYKHIAKNYTHLFYVLYLIVLNRRFLNSIGNDILIKKVQALYLNINILFLEY